MNTNIPMNPYHEFLRMVYRMRAAQVKFFNSKSSSDLKASIALEKQVDDWLKRCGFEAQKIAQMRFDSEKPN
jgi:hypothetical protein